MEIRFDFSDFQKKFGDVVRRQVPEATEKGIGVAMLQMLNDCVMEVPTVPIKEGWLRGSGSIFVQNKLVSVSKHGKKKYANTDFSEYIGNERLIGVIGFNTPYAAKMHEGIGYNFTDPSAGAKYLESKMLRNKDTYMLIIANRIKEGKK